LSVLVLTSFSYMSSAVDRLKEFENTYGDDGKTEINGICFAHVLTIDLDEDNKFSYCGVKVVDGKLTIVFKEGQMGTNNYYALEKPVLQKALNDAPPAKDSASTLSYTARAAIRTDYEPKISESQKKIAEYLEQPDIKLTPNFEANFAVLKEESGKKKTELRDDWESNIGYMTLKYFEGIAWQLKSQKFDDDEMLREGFNEAVDKGEIAFRVVEKLQKGSYNEVVIDGGVCYIQVGRVTIPLEWTALTIFVDYSQELRH
jgi:hypothetical protein